MLSVREIQSEDIEYIIRYWLDADPEFLKGMGVDTCKMPLRDEWEKMLSDQIAQHYFEKKSYCTIWQLDNQPIGHCNINKIKFGEEAYMHLHMWNADGRKKGMGTELVKMSLPYFFEKMELNKIYCEPYVMNLAPNKTLKKAGFTFLKEYRTIPGFLNFEQAVNLWELTYEQYIKQK